jgi:hypothetical protein
MEATPVTQVKAGLARIIVLVKARGRDSIERKWAVEISERCSEAYYWSRGARNLRIKEIHDRRQEPFGAIPFL